MQFRGVSGHPCQWALGVAIRSGLFCLTVLAALVSMHAQAVWTQSRARNHAAPQAVPAALATWLECEGVFFGPSAHNKEDWKGTYLIKDDELFSYFEGTLTFMMRGNADVIQGNDNSGSFHQKVELDRKTGLLHIYFTNAGPLRQVAADCHVIAPPPAAPRF